MKKLIMGILLVCVMGLGVMALFGCKEEKKSVNPATLLLFGSQPKYFPEIPQGVAQ
jgi:hypothetical protein